MEPEPIPAEGCHLFRPWLGLRDVRDLSGRSSQQNTRCGVFGQGNYSAARPGPLPKGVGAALRIFSLKFNILSINIHSS